MHPARLALLSAALLAASSVTAAPPPCTAQAALDVSQIAPQILVVGEMHGTEQAPRFVSGLVCSLLQAGQGVILALERNGAEQLALNQYLSSAGTPEDQAALWRQPAWTSATQDGRNSAAMMTLIDDVRRLRASGQRVGILAMQQASVELAPLREDEKTPLDGRDTALYSRINDRSMADAILAAGTLHGNYKIVVLAGGTHTAVKRPAWAEPSYLPMGALVVAERPAYFIALNTDGGTTWVYNGRDRGAVRKIDAGRFVSAGAQVDAEVSLGKVTASPPAAASR